METRQPIRAAIERYPEFAPAHDEIQALSGRHISAEHLEYVIRRIRTLRGKQLSLETMRTVIETFRKLVRMPQAHLIVSARTAAKQHFNEHTHIMMRRRARKKYADIPSWQEAYARGALVWLALQRVEKARQEHAATEPELPF